MEEGKVVDILDTDKMNQESQFVMEQTFDLSKSTPITMYSLRARLGFCSNTEFAVSLLAGEVHIRWFINDVTAMILREIICLFEQLREGYGVVTLGVEQFQFYWQIFKECLSSSI